MYMLKLNVSLPRGREADTLQLMISSNVIEYR
jgi:hypothetical protein